jgi:hypothetical protein
MNIQFMNNQELAEKLLLMRIAQGQWEQLPIKDKLQKVRKFRLGA